MRDSLMASWKPCSGVSVFRVGNQLSSAWAKPIIRLNRAGISRNFFMSVSLLCVRGVMQGRAADTDTAGGCLPLQCWTGSAWATCYLGAGPLLFWFCLVRFVHDSNHVGCLVGVVLCGFVVGSGPGLCCGYAPAPKQASSQVLMPGTDLDRPQITTLPFGREWPGLAGLLSRCWGPVMWCLLSA